MISIQERGLRRQGKNHLFKPWWSTWNKKHLKNTLVLKGILNDVGIKRDDSCNSTSELAFLLFKQATG